MTKLTLQDMASGFNSQTTYNENNTAIEAAVENTLSRDGSTPNQMNADLDMNSQEIANASAVRTGSLYVNGQLITASSVDVAGKQVYSATATAGQTLFTGVNEYTQGIVALDVYINGVYQDNTQYTETSTTSITFNTGLNAGDYVVVISASDQTVNVANASAVPFTQTGSSTVRNVATKLNESISVKDFGAVGDGTTDDTVALQSAHDEGKSVYYPPGDYLISSTVNITTDNQLICGASWGSATGGSVARVFASTDIKMFNVTGDWVTFEDMLIDNTASSMANYHIHLNNNNFPEINKCRIQAASNTSATGGGILIDNGAGGVGGIAALINNTNLSHSFIRVLRSDVHIKNCWLWANSRPYAVYGSGSVGNLVIEGTDVLPPQTTVAGRKAAIYLTGSMTAPRILGCNFDGNLSLTTGSGALIENGVINPVIEGCYGFGHDEDCIILDSVISPIVQGCTFTNNNLSEDGSVDISLRESGAQPLEKPLIQGNAFTQTLALAGTTGPAIELQTGVTRKGVRIIDNTIHQPGAGGGYDDIEIKLVDGAFADEQEGCLTDNRGTRTLYMISDTMSYLVADTFKTATYPVTMAYAPRPDQISINVACTGAPPDLRLNSAALPGTTSVGFGFHGTFTDGTLYYRIAL